MARRSATALALALGLAWGASAAGAQQDPLGAVADRVRAHDDEAALRALAALPAEGRRRPGARYLRGRLLERLGRHAEAARAYEGLAEGLPAPVAADARFRRAAALARAGRCERALPELGAFTGERPGDRGALARALEAQCTLTSGAHRAAIARLRAVAQEDARGIDTFAVRLGLAQALREAGDGAAAARELRLLRVERPEHPDVDGLEAQLERWGSPVALTAEERMTAAARLLDRNAPRAAVELLGGPPPSGRQDRARFLHLRGMALYGTRHDYAEAARVLAQAARLGGPTAVEDELHAARALSRSDQDDRAIAAYRRFVRRHGDHRLAPLAEYLAAWLELHHGRRAGARHMERFLRGPRGRASPDLARDATWHLALAAFEGGRWGPAAEGFERYARLGDARDPMVRGRGLYWLGRARMEAGERERALAAWREALWVEPLHWYALLSRQRLLLAGEPDPAPFPPAEAREARAPLPPPSLPDEVALYASLGLRADAVAALRRHEEAIAAQAPEGRGREAVTVAYGVLGEAARPYRLVAVRERDELSRRPDPANRWVWEAAYPRPWRSEVDRVARAQGLAPEYLWAIMRQESGYDPEAVSYADAVGLLQLLPRTAERVAAQQGIAFSREMLFDAAWNLRLAAAYNGGLYEAFGRRAPLSIGAFNAGGPRMRSWLDARGGALPLDHFVERIPFDQTRNYVRRVTTHLSRYLYLSRGEPDAWPTTLPLDLGGESQSTRPPGG